MRRGPCSPPVPSEAGAVRRLRHEPASASGAPCPRPLVLAVPGASAAAPLPRPGRPVHTLLPSGAPRARGWGRSFCFLRAGVLRLPPPASPPGPSSPAVMTWPPLSPGAPSASHTLRPPRDPHLLFAAPEVLWFAASAGCQWPAVLGSRPRGPADSCAVSLPCGVDARRPWSPGLAHDSLEWCLLRPSAWRGRRSV